ncbi:MAG TPA: putative baseplate assembly protein [Pyrinomonadaceae bacterium]|nr:putative baseplate assembly protein [Pyrinomonadaceae bacterium]
MPLQIPTLDDRRYQELLDEMLARIPVHNPQWTNFNKSDPGVTLVEIFAFLTESLLYRSNQIPERNRRKFLTLLGVPLQPASSARGLVTFANERGPLQTLTLNDELEVRAGQVPFRTERGLDVLPIEAQIFYKRKILNADQKLKDYYKLLYSSYNQPPLNEAEFQLYESVPLDPRKIEGVDLGQETADGSLWIALLLRAGDKPADKTESARTALLNDARRAIEGKTLSLGIVPALTDVTRRLSPAGPANPESATLLQYQIPNIPASGGLATDSLQRNPQYKSLEATVQTDVLAAPGIVDITLPSASELKLWNNLEPLEPGAGDFPPALDDTNLNDRLITWLRISATAAARARLLWVGINTVFVTQRARISNEVLPEGTGAPDQVMFLSRKPLVPGSVRLTVTDRGETKQWKEIDDLYTAGPEVKVPDLRSPPGSQPPPERPSEVFTVNSESGEIKFGDGMRGKRPPRGATVRASYDYGVGAAGNVGEGAINNSPSLPAGLKVTNPVRTWNGTEAETINEGEKQITRYLQHRDRLVSAADFETITWRTPGVDIGRVEVIPAFNPSLAPNEPGGAAGAVTLMLIPRFDPNRPTAPKPDRLFLDTVCRYLDPRRLVTTELFLRGPDYKDIWITVGINVVAGATVPTVREAVKRDLLQFLVPFDPAQTGPRDSLASLLNSPESAGKPNGWPLRKPVTDRELLAVASRVPGVLLVNDVKIAEGAKPSVPQINMTGLELPRVAGISVTVGEPLALDQLRGQTASTTTTTTTTTTTAPKIVPVPVVPEEC